MTKNIECEYNCKIVRELKQKYEDVLKLAKENADANEYCLQELERELEKYKNMEAIGLEEFKDIGGCWGCGLKLQLEQDMEDIKRLKTENEKIKESNQAWGLTVVKLRESLDLLEKQLQQARDNYVELDLLRVKSEELHKKELEYWQSNYSKLYQKLEK